MNKKLTYIFVFLIIGVFVISSCEQYIGRKINKVTDARDEDINNAQAINLKGRGDNIAKPEYDVKVVATGEAVDLYVITNEGNEIVDRVMYYNPYTEEVEFGEDRDEPLVANDGTRIRAEDMGESELSGMSGIKFIYDKGDESHILKIKNINTLSNKTSFRDINTEREYDDLPINTNAGSRTEFDFLGEPFTLEFQREVYRGNNQIYTPEIYFTDITNDESGGGIRTSYNGKVYFKYQQFHKPHNARLVIASTEDDDGEITIYSSYDERDQEINIGQVNIEGYAGMGYENGLDRISQWIKDAGITFIRARGVGNDEVKIKLVSR